mgnify:CR=1 FL=1
MVLSFAHVRLRVIFFLVVHRKPFEIVGSIGSAINGTFSGRITFGDLFDGSISITDFADEDNMVHGSVRTLGTVTGRMTHNNPNMAQVPSVRAVYGDRCRSLWVPKDRVNNVLLGTDAEGLEHHVSPETLEAFKTVIAEKS